MNGSRERCQQFWNWSFLKKAILSTKTNLAATKFEASQRHPPQIHRAITKNENQPIKGHHLYISSFKGNVTKNNTINNITSKNDENMNLC